MMRRYYVRAIDEKTGEPCLDAVIEAGSPRDALFQGHRDAVLAAEHFEVRVTQIAEQSANAAGSTATNLQRERTAA